MASWLRPGHPWGRRAPASFVVAKAWVGITARPTTLSMGILMARRKLAVMTTSATPTQTIMGLRGLPLPSHPRRTITITMDLVSAPPPMRARHHDSPRPCVRIRPLLQRRLRSRPPHPFPQPVTAISNVIKTSPPKQLFIAFTPRNFRTPMPRGSLPSAPLFLRTTSVNNHAILRESNRDATA